jgi:hypothetical protein
MKSPAWKKLGIVLGTLVIVLTIILTIIGIALPKLLDLNRYHGLVVSEMEKAIGGKVKLTVLFDMDLDFHIPYSAPIKSRLNGTVSTRNAGFQLASSNWRLQKET